MILLDKNKSIHHCSLRYFGDFVDVLSSCERRTYSILLNQFTIFPYIKTNGLYFTMNDKNVSCETCKTILNIKNIIE